MSHLRLPPRRLAALRGLFLFLEDFWNDVPAVHAFDPGSQIVSIDGDYSFCKNIWGESSGFGLFRPSCAFSCAYRAACTRNTGLPLALFPNTIPSILDSAYWSLWLFFWRLQPLRNSKRWCHLVLFSNLLYGWNVATRTLVLQQNGQNVHWWGHVGPGPLPMVKWSEEASQEMGSERSEVVRPSPTEQKPWEWAWEFLSFFSFFFKRGFSLSRLPFGLEMGGLLNLPGLSAS